MLFPYCSYPSVPGDQFIRLYEIEEKPIPALLISMLQLRFKMRDFIGIKLYFNTVKRSPKNHQCFSSCKAAVRELRSSAAPSPTSHFGWNGGTVASLRNVDTSVGFYLRWTALTKGKDPIVIAVRKFAKSPLFSGPSLNCNRMQQ